MSIKLEDCLYSKNKEGFEEIEKKANGILLKSLTTRLIASNLKLLIKDYADKADVHLKILYLPFHDTQVWGMFYKKSEIYFIIINSEVSISKQNVALAHEFYHFLDSLETESHSPIDIFKEIETSHPIDIEDNKANAFSSCLLMPADVVRTICNKNSTDIYEQIAYIKVLMDVFVVPYKTAVIRLYELSIFNFETANSFLLDENRETQSIIENIKSSFNSQRWEKNFDNYYDLDDLTELINENENYEFISEKKALETRLQVEEIIKKIINPFTIK